MATERASATGGREMVSLEVARELAARGHELDVYWAVGGDLEADYREFSRSVHRAHLQVRRPGLLPNFLRASPSLWSATRRRPDVVYVQTFAYIPFATLVTRATRAPLVCHLHGYTHYNKALLLARQVSRFISVSEDSAQQMDQKGRGGEQDQRRPQRCRRRSLLLRRSR